MRIAFLVLLAFAAADVLVCLGLIALAAAKYRRVRARAAAKGHALPSVRGEFAMIGLALVAGLAALTAAAVAVAWAGG